MPKHSIFATSMSSSLVLKGCLCVGVYALALAGSERPAITTDGSKMTLSGGQGECFALRVLTLVVRRQLRPQQ